MTSSTKKILCLSLLACFWGLQVAILLQQWLMHWAAPLVFKTDLLPEGFLHMAPKWDLFIYLVFVVFSVGTGRLLLRFYQGPIRYRYVIFEGILTFLMISALFKMLVYFDSPQLAQFFLDVLMIVAVAGKIFYPELHQWVGFVHRWIKASKMGRYADAFWVIFIGLIIYMPNLEHVMALIYIGDWMHHFDYLVMSVGWASLWGQIPFVDVISQYGVGLPIILAHIIKATGPFDYVQALNVLMWFAIFYFIAMYGLVRYWLGSALMAGIAFLLVFRLQMFHFGVSPLIWITPSASPVRFGLDVLWMALLLLHLRTGQWQWLLLAAFYSGFAVYYMSSTGAYILASFYFYLILQWPSLSKKKINYAACWFLPIVAALVFFSFTVGAHLFEKAYWLKFSDYLVAFELWGQKPMWESLKYRHFWAFFMSMVVPLTYLSTLLYAGACRYLKKGDPSLVFVAVLCVYGLANYQYYVVRAAITSYYVNAMPFVLISCYWFGQALGRVSPVWQRRLKISALVLSFYALWTNQNYLAYPNVFNFSRNPMTDNLVIQRFPDRTGFFNNQYKKTLEADKLAVNDLGNRDEDLLTEDDFHSDEQLVEYYHRHFDFAKDAALIDQYVKPASRAAVLSSFETKILIQANRPPYFYHLPAVSSRPMTFRSLPVDDAQTPSYLPQTMAQLKDAPPDYIFMEKVFLLDNLPASYHNGQDKRMERMMSIVDHVRAHYRPVAFGQYLVAMKREGG